MEYKPITKQTGLTSKGAPPNRRASVCKTKIYISAAFKGKFPNKRAVVSLGMDGETLREIKIESTDITDTKETFSVAYTQRGGFTMNLTKIIKDFNLSGGYLVEEIPNGVIIKVLEHVQKIREKA